MKPVLDNRTLWNEAAKGGAYLGGISVGCLALKELAALSGIGLLVQASVIVLWAVQFFGCILVMKNLLVGLRDRYENVQMADTFRLGKRSALLSGLLLASAQTLFVLKMPEADLTALVDSALEALPAGMDRDQLEGTVMDMLPPFTFIFQWVYCFLYGTVLASLLSRYVFLKKLFGNPLPPRPDGENTPDEQ